VKVNRGKATLSDLYDISISKKATVLLMVYEKKGNPSMIKIYKPEVLKTELVEKYRILLRGVTLYREKIRSKLSKYNGIYCISFNKNGLDDVYSLASIVSEVTGYRFCIEDSNPGTRYIRIFSGDGVLVVSFQDENGNLAGPIVRVRRIEVIGYDSG
jgi:U3 small nucleolar ribonucleoprotein protein IMP4